MSANILGEFLFSYGAGWMQIGPSRVGTFKVQVMDRDRVTNERVTMRCTSNVDTITGWRDAPESTERWTERKAILLAKYQSFLDLALCLPLC